MSRRPLRSRRGKVLVGAILLLAAGAASAGAKEPPNVVAPLTVFPPGDPPKIVASFPAAGEVIAPGALVMRITFDQKMDAAAFAFTAAQSGQMPSCLKTPRLLNDEKTFVLLCTTAPDQKYDIAFNAAPKAGFKSIAGSAAAPAQLAFATNHDDDGPRDLDSALKIAKLTAEDVPIATQP
jgi:hypothetical protein